MVESKVFSYAYQVFDEMRERVFMLLLRQLTYAESWGWLSSVGRGNSRNWDM